MSLDTQPMGLDSLGGGVAGLDEFRVGSPIEIQSYLKKLADGNVTIFLNGPAGRNVATTVWAVDAAGGSLVFSADARDATLQQLLLAGEIVAVGYLDSVKLQWDVHGAMLVHGGTGSALRCAFPRLMYRFQRRNSYRVRPLPRSGPLARLTEPVQQALRVLDVSIGGCALFYPDGGVPIGRGDMIRNATLELDAETRLAAHLLVHHASPMGGELKGMRLGCELVQLARDAERALQRFIDQTQKKRRLFDL